MNLQKQAEKHIAQGCGTYSKHPNQFMFPKDISHADYYRSGTIIIENKSIIDFMGGLGANMMNTSSSVSSLPFKEELTLSKMIADRFPCIEKMKFLKTGSEACEAAVRIARAGTKRLLVWGAGYHGWGNTFISVEKPGAGTYYSWYKKAANIDELIKWLKNLRGTDKYFLAAIIIEPVQLDINVKPQLKWLRAFTKKHGIILIFDETITGLRFPKYCVANYFGIQPDLMILGKALGGGHPLALVGGRADLVDNPDYFVSSTFAGDQYALRSAIENFDLATPDNISRLWRRGKVFCSKFNALSKNTRIVGYPTRGEIQGDELEKGLFLQTMWERGFLFGRAFFISWYHTQEILEKTLKDAKEVFALIKAGKVKLKGKLPRPVFKRN